MEEGLYLVLILNHVFVGRMTKEQPKCLVDVVEFIPMIDPNGQIKFNGLVLGDLYQNEGAHIKLSKDSPYWTAYYKASMKLSH